MSSQLNKSKRWRPRFSVRTLVVVVTLVCGYAACWRPTETLGLRDVPRHAFQGTIGLSSGDAEQDAQENERFYLSFNASVVLPLVVRMDWDIDSPRTHRYYFWFFGYVVKLPYEREFQGLPPPPRIPDGMPGFVSGPDVLRGVHGSSSPPLTR